MKNFIFTALCLMISNGVFAQEKNQTDWANFGKYAESNEITLPGAAAVFMGNSITEGWASADPAFFTRNNYICRGISGQVTAQMLVRFRADVIELNPRSVVILAGTNDIARNNGYISLENILGNIVSMTELAKAHGIKVIICSVLPVYEYRWAPGLKPAGLIIKLNGMLQQYAKNNNIQYVDYHSAMKDDRDGLPKKYAADGVHPNIEGYRLMEGILKPFIDKVTGK